MWRHDVPVDHAEERWVVVAPTSGGPSFTVSARLKETEFGTVIELKLCDPDQNYRFSPARFRTREIL